MISKSPKKIHVLVQANNLFFFQFCCCCFLSIISVSSTLGETFIWGHFIRLRCKQTPTHSIHSYSEIFYSYYKKMGAKTSSCRILIKHQMTHKQLKHKGRVQESITGLQDTQYPTSATKHWIDRYSMLLFGHYTAFISDDWNWIWIEDSGPEYRPAFSINVSMFNINQLFQLNISTSNIHYQPGRGGWEKEGGGGRRR